MVEIIQRRDLSATAGTGSSILSADIMARLFIAVLNQIFHSQHPISLQKIILRQKTRKDENRLAFQPDFQAHGTLSGGRCDCGHC